MTTRTRTTPGTAPRTGAHPGTRLRTAAHRRARLLARTIAGLALTLIVTATGSACSTIDNSTVGGQGGPDPDRYGKGYWSGTLRVLASSELADMAPVLEEARKATGVTVRPTYAGTLDAVEQIASGEAEKAYDAIWLSSNDYLRLRPDTAARITGETPIMTSPVAVGIRPAAVTRLGWDPAKVTWSQLHKAVAEKKLTYGMTDPMRSNSGFSALVSVASGLSGAQSALTAQDVTRATPRLKEFFAGQTLTSGSSGWLATAYGRRTDVDALVNYESVLLSAPGKLTVIRPSDGVVTADYPFTLLTSARAEAKEAAGRLTTYLRTPDAQRRITETTLRRPVVPGVHPAAALARDQRRELPFPGSRAVADGLLDAYDNTLRRPSRTVYVLDTSGSMAGGRLERLKTALAELTGDFRDREEVTLMPFGSTVKQHEVRTHTVDPASPRAALDAIRTDAGKLSASGGTAIYSSVQEAYRFLGTTPGDTFTSIVLMTDGENTDGDPASAFDAFYRSLPAEQQRTPVFPILFGDSDRGELDHIASLTGGKLFDAQQGSLDGAFEEIRGYQ
ncbi:substrate-binding and VWA domain-containing protein [Streptomyces sp. NBC_00094]|uniref:substrate-binding and vWA domain-containing protein n=1 Tax=Streptomyces sp. NBC_00094 TaxID=2903620 RepID=UPI0022567D59|nr:substrate-binding and VWA domain-containing protein [Streptomyces sp. NBC_00094]MCX5392876.1 substrate-binding and VWA domain-containing protein [Streptomyces sp. NBC_00094]